MAEANSLSRKSRVRKIYRERCAVCQFMKKNPAFRMRVMQSKYFQPSGHEGLTAIVHDFGDPFKMTAIYMHMQRHQERDLIAAKKRFDEIEAPSRHNSGPVSAAVANQAVESPVMSTDEHERGLDEFIREGHEKLLRKEMPISATNYLAAIKIKAEINKSAKDRRLALIKQFFSGNQDGQTETTDSSPTTG